MSRASPPPKDDGGSLAQDRCSEGVLRDLADRIERMEEALWLSADRLDVARRQLELVHASTSWRVTRPLRAVAPGVRPLAVAVRRGVRVLRWASTGQLRARLSERRAALRDVSKPSSEAYSDWIALYDELDDSDLAGMRKLYDGLVDPPLVSVLMPVYDPPEPALEQAIESVRAQVYANWELCIADDASTDPRVRALLASFERADSRIRVVHRAENGGISAASNSALELASGEIVALLDHDDLLRPHSLLLTARKLIADKRVQFVYSDADRIDVDGRRLSHYFKPDWNPALLLCQNFLCHVSVMRAARAREVGGFRSEFDGSQDWDLALRVVEGLDTDQVVHVPHVLYHWRAIPGSVAADGRTAKPYAFVAARRAVESHLRRVGRPGYALPTGAHQVVRYCLPTPAPAVDVVVPSTGDPKLLSGCLDGLLAKTTYGRVRIFVAVAAQALDEPESARYLESIRMHPQVHVLVLPDEPFNFSAVVNRTVRETDADLLLLLNDDVEVTYADWLTVMVGHTKDDDVGVVGARLFYPDGTLYSAGMLIGARGVAEHYYHRRHAHVSGYSNRARLSQDVSAVAGTCMLVRRAAFMAVGGLDETFPVAYNDVDFCLRLRRAGWRTLYASDAHLIHHGSASFGTHQLGRADEHTRDEMAMRERWAAALDDDPMHNPNLALDASYPGRLAFPPRVAYPWREVV